MKSKVQQQCNKPASSKTRDCSPMNKHKSLWSWNWDRKKVTKRWSQGFALPRIVPGAIGTNGCSPASLADGMLYPAKYIIRSETKGVEGGSGSDEHDGRQDKERIPKRVRTMTAQQIKALHWMNMGWEDAEEKFTWRWKKNPSCAQWEALSKGREQRGAVEGSIGKTSCKNVGRLQWQIAYIIDGRHLRAA